jgi:hypothetical protein
MKALTTEHFKCHPFKISTISVLNYNTFFASRMNISEYYTISVNAGRTLEVHQLSINLTLSLTG